MFTFEKHLPKMIASQIIEDIVNSHLKSGERVIEEHYAKSFGTSRGPVREALYLLEKEGMIEKIPKRGAFVKKYNIQDLCDLFEVRVSLEIMSVNRITYPLSEESISGIDDIIYQMKNATLEEYPKLNNDFHYKILTLSKNEVFKSVYSSLGAPLLALQNLALKEPENIKQSYEDHKMLWEAIKTEKIIIAKAVLENHVESGKNRFINTLCKNKH